MPEDYKQASHAHHWREPSQKHPLVPEGWKSFTLQVVNPSGFLFSFRATPTGLRYPMVVWAVQSTNVNRDYRFWVNSPLQMANGWGQSCNIAVALGGGELDVEILIKDIQDAQFFQISDAVVGQNTRIRLLYLTAANQYRTVVDDTNIVSEAPNSFGLDLS